jgi:hypothetical protein
LDVALAKAEAFFPDVPQGSMPDVVFCNSHRKRMVLNHALNLFAARHLQEAEKVFIPCTKSKSLGVTMLPQDMIIWKGMELLGCIHKSDSKTVVNGVLYVVKGWDDRHIFLDVHPRYKKQPEEVPEDEEDDEEAEEEVVDPGEGEIPVDVKLSRENVSKWLRPTFARCYGSIQGCTMEKQHILLIDTRASRGGTRHFTLRHLIVGVSRATHQDFVHIASAEDEAMLMREADAFSKVAMGPGGLNPTTYEVVEDELQFPAVADDDVLDAGGDVVM